MSQLDFGHFELVPDAILVTDSAGRIEFANRQAEGFFGYAQSELIGRSIEVLVPERFRSAHIDQREKFTAQPQSRPMGSGLSLIGRKKDGTELPVDISLAPLSGDDGIRIVAAVHDISEHRHEQESLESLHEVAVASSGVVDPVELSHLVVERARDLLRGDDATLLWWDPAESKLRILADTFRRPFPREVAVGEGTAGIAFERGQPVIVDDYPHWEHAVADSLSRGLKSVVAVPLLVRDRPVGALTVSFTTQRTLGRPDVRLLSLFAAQVAPALEAARLHEALLQMSTKLKDASEAKSRFLASMSHELRTPLNAIIGFSDLLISEPTGAFAPSKRSQFLDQIHKAGIHLLSLINDILDLSKVEAGQMDLRLTSFDLMTSINQTIETVGPLVDQKRLTLQVEPDVRINLYADEGKVRQMLLNLLSNAIKFTPEGGRIAVSASPLADEVVVGVADTGIGIAAQDQARLFVEFQQLDQGPGRRQQGTGLGLALTKRLAELQGGRVWVESEVGSGSRFFFALPTRAVEPQRPGMVVESEPQPNGPLVMVVEDQDSAAALLSFTLRRAGYRVELVRSGKQVLERAIRLRPHAITLDILLPDPDGWDILRALKVSPETRDIPVVVISVLDDRSLGFALGADEYLVKPVSREALEKFLNRRGVAGGQRQRTARILAVDDDPVTLQLLKETLEPQFRVLTASDGPSGIELARSERPDAVILDLMLPDMSGFEVASALKADAATMSIPILILTAKDLSEEDKTRLNGHVSRVMRKGEAATADLLKWLENKAVLAEGSQDR
jgi:PAS domain S-box-containing protein